MKIAILGWGSLLWDPRPEFDNQHEDWQYDGPRLKIEFSRISSKSRQGALTLVIDPKHGDLCQVAYTLSRRRKLSDAICDLRCREDTVKYIGVYQPDRAPGPGVDAESWLAIQSWWYKKEFDAVIWTTLPSNFKDIYKKQFSVKNALSYVQKLPPEAKAKAAEYVWRAPYFVQTLLRRELQSPPWFPRID